RPGIALLTEFLNLLLGAVNGVLKFLNSFGPLKNVLVAMAGLATTLGVIKRLMDSMAVREWVSALGVGFKTIVEMGARVVAGMRAAGGFMPYVGRLMGRAGSAVGRFAGTTAFGRFMMGLTDVVGYAPMGVVHPAFQR